MGKFLCSVAALVVLASSAFGSAITADGTWHEFCWGAQSAPTDVFVSTACSPTTNPAAEQLSTVPWTFSGPASLFVLDVGHVGDQFQIFDNLTSIGTTSAIVSNDGVNPCGDDSLDIACAMTFSDYSHGTFLLGAGNHSITIQTIRFPTGTANSDGFFSGVAAFQLDAVPEPGTLSLLAMGLAFFATRRRRS